jgi:hypothetical protein
MGNSFSMSFLLEILKVVIIVGKNKYGYQLGVKYYNAFHIDNLLLQLEYNHVRHVCIRIACLLLIMDIIIKVWGIS